MTRPAPRILRYRAAMSPLLSVAVLSTALLSTALVSGCGRQAADVTASAPQVNGAMVTFPAGSRQLAVLHSEPVEEGATSTLLIPGRISWDETRSSALRSPLAGQVAKLDVAQGAHVKAGQVIAWITSPEFGQAQAERARGRAELKQARNELERVRELHGAGVASGRELDEAEAAFAAAQSEHARAVAFASSYGNGAAIDQRLPLRSPIDGVLVERRMSPGMSVSPDAERPLAVVGDPDRLWLLLDAPEGMANQLRAGMEVTVADPAGGALKTQLQHVDDYVDSERRVVQARAEIDNSARHFKAGQYVQAGVIVPAQGGVTVPDAAVMLINGEQVVFIDHGQGRYERRVIRADELGDGRLWIKDGIPEADRVVTEGGLLLQQLVDGGRNTTAVASAVGAGP